MKQAQILIFSILISNVVAQEAHIMYQTNGLWDSLYQKNPFNKFVGEWTLKDDQWTQNWGGKTETILIPQHHTNCTQINTANSLLSIIDGPEPNGHIFWSYNPVTKAVNHLSSFGALRAGVGEGSISEDGDLQLKITFEGEPKHTYRNYNYTWISPDQYHMKSVQFDSTNTPTGLFYEGTFVRIDTLNDGLEKQINEILNVLDNNEITIEEQLRVYAEDIIHMAPASEEHEGKKALAAYLKEQRTYGKPIMKHEIIEIEPNPNAIIMRGRVIGTFYPNNGIEGVAFRTKNLFIFKYYGNELKIKKVIYNMSPIE